MKTLDGPRVGKLGEVVASRNHYGQHLHKKGHPKKRRTPDRLQANWAMRAVAEGWENLTDQQRDRWYFAAPGVPSRKVLGKSGRLDGRGFFSKVNLPRARLGMELLTDPPARTDPGPNPAVAFNIFHDASGIALKLTLSRVPAEELLLRASPPCNAGKRRNWDYRVLDVLSAPVKGLSDITELYVRKYGVPPVGKRVFIRIVQQMNGWRGQPWEASAVVPPKSGRSERRKGR